MAKKKQNPPQSKSYTKSGDIQAGKAKPVGKRYTDKLAKKLGKSSNAEPTQKDINKYLGKGVYDEKRKDKSDISLRKKFELGGGAEFTIYNSKDLKNFWENPENANKTIYFVEEIEDEGENYYVVGNQNLKYYKDSQYWDYDYNFDDIEDAIKQAKAEAKKNKAVYAHNLRVINGYRTGGKVKQNPPQSKSYTKKNDIQAGKAKPVGKRYTDKLAKKLGKSPNAEPTQKDINKYLGKGVYDEKRKDKSDISLSKKFEDGGATVEISVEEMKSSLGREPRYPSDFINGKKYVKCFLRPYYRLAD